MIIEDRGWLRSTLFSSSLDHGFGTRHSQLSVQYRITPRQTHSTAIATITSSSLEQAVDADGLVTAESGVHLTIKTADCLPVIYADPAAKVVGISHNGWKGTYDNMAAAMIEAMVRIGASVGRIRAVVGPAVGGCCYRLYGDRLTQFYERYPVESALAVSISEGETYLDLAKLNYLQLIAAGVPGDQIDHGVFCTRCDSARFYSYQREGAGCSHMTSYIILT